jgi:predicted metal-dependent phosphoesterase TrpH
MILDMHVHTTYSSCSRLTLAEVLENARMRGLDGVCVTDHNTIAGRNEAREGIQQDGLCLLFGMEYDTPQGDFLVFGSFDNLEPGMEARELLRFVNSHEGAAIAAHPFRADRRVDLSLFEEEGLCRIVEGINGRNTDEENLQVKKLAQDYGLVQCGGSDAHQLSELGKTATRFQMPVTSKGDLVKALRKGLCAPVTWDRGD